MSCGVLLLVEIFHFLRIARYSEVTLTDVSFDPTTLPFNSFRIEMFENLLAPISIFPIEKLHEVASLPLLCRREVS